MGYTFLAIKGVSWIGGIRVVTRILSFLKTAIIARILTPSDFGLFGIVTLVLIFIEILLETGINIFLIQQRDSIDKYVNTAWVVSIVRGLLIAGLILVLTPLIVIFFSSPDVVPLLLFSAAIPIVRGFINPSIIIYQKELFFQKEFFLRTSLFFIETLVSIVLVIYTREVWSLIAALLIGAVCEVLFSIIWITPRPKFQFHKEQFKKILFYGKWITFSKIMNYFYQNGDTIAIGRLIGTRALGVYDMAYKISLAPISDIGDVISKVTFPVYVKISGDKKRLQRAYLKSLGVVVCVTVPIGFFFFFFPELVITTVLGRQWLDSVEVLKVLAFFGVIRASMVYSSSLFFALKQQRILTYLSAIELGTLALSIVPFIGMWGITGAAYSAFLATVVIFFPFYYFVYKLLQSSS